ncbi:MAG: MarR family transcriptional regulator [Saccharofermentans sp.]|nr:MarR family transcriptional regulator [Saccharofermentans sp.]
MREEELELADRLVRIFENVLFTEEKSIQQGYFSDLSIAEMHTLDAIGSYEARTMSETAAALGITTGTLTVSIDRLVKKGYVIRNRDEKDRRVVRIRLTREGKLASRMHGKYHKVLARHILEPYTKEEQDLLLGMVRELDVYLEAQASRYNGSESVRKTAKEVAAKIRRRENDDG